MKSFIRALFGGFALGFLIRLVSAPTVGGDTNVWGTTLNNFIGQFADLTTGQLLDSAMGRQTMNGLAAATTAYTLVKSDQGKLVISNASSAVTITVPTDAAMTGGAMDIVSTTSIRQGGAGQIAIQGAAGVTINSRGGLTHTAGQYSHIALVKIAANTYDLVGDLA